VDGLHGEGRLGDVDGEERHQRGERVLIEPVVQARPQVGGEAVAGCALGGQGGDDGDAAFASGERGAGPCGSA
jgi:hypothetical protein